MTDETVLIDRIRRSHDSRDAQIAAIAAHFGGVIDRRSLHHTGLADEGIASRVRRGTLHRVHPHVYAVGHPVLGDRGRRWAAVLFGGDATTDLTHLSALALRGYHRTPTVHDITLPAARRARKDLRIHRSYLPAAERARVDGYPTTTLERAMVDSAEVLRTAALARLLRDVDRRDELDPTAVLALCGRYPTRPGAAALLRALLAHLPQLGFTRSDFEDTFPQFCAARGLPRPRMNAWVAEMEVDAHFDGTHVVVELDTIAFHRTRHELERDDEKRGALAVAGYSVFPLTATRLERHPAAVAEQLRTLLARG